LGWSDVGSWNAVWEINDQDGAGNATDGPVIHYGQPYTLVRSDASMLTTVIGVDDVVVIST